MMLNFLSKTPTLEETLSFLIKEYGFLLPQVQKTTTVEFKKLELKLINLNHELLQKVAKEDLTSYENIKQPIIVLKRDEFQLIDGYHRLALAYQKQETTIDCLILS